mmetsp:Transcript_13994/g.34606  ORF Transcript_13994/g.34606 Transcript_13994/m.34606 type:complete len:236 (+) Transcript_13994:601-1308(+)
MTRLGTQCSRTAEKLVYLPEKNTQSASTTEFHWENFPYRMLFSTSATYVWQLSTQPLCVRPRHCRFPRASASFQESRFPDAGSGERGTYLKTGPKASPPALVAPKPRNSQTSPFSSAIPMWPITGHSHVSPHMLHQTIEHGYRSLLKSNFAGRASEPCCVSSETGSRIPSWSSSGDAEDAGDAFPTPLGAGGPLFPPLFHLREAAGDDISVSFSPPVSASRSSPGLCSSRPPPRA